MNTKKGTLTLEIVKERSMSFVSPKMLSIVKDPKNNPVKIKKTNSRRRE